MRGVWQTYLRHPEMGLTLVCVTDIQTKRLLGMNSRWQDNMAQDRLLAYTNISLPTEEWYNEIIKFSFQI